MPSRSVLAPVEAFPNAAWNTPVRKNPFDMPMQPKLDLLLQINEEALKVNGASFVNAFMQFVQRAEVLRVDRGVAHRAVADPLLSELLGHVGRPRDRQVLRAAAP